MTFEEYKDNYFKRWQKRMMRYFIIVFIVHAVATSALNISFLIAHIFDPATFAHHMIFRTLLPIFLHSAVLVPTIFYLRSPKFSTRNKCRAIVFDFFWITTTLAFIHSKYTLFHLFPVLPMIIAAMLQEKRMLKIVFIADLITAPVSAILCSVIYTHKFESSQIVSGVSLLCAMTLVYYISKEILRAQNSHIEFMRHNYNRQVTLAEELQIEPLTKVYNRFALKNSVSKLLKQISKPDYDLENSPATLVFFDLDNFKHINDTFGHATGYAVLVALGKAIIQVMETNRNAFRYGGDEFILLIRDTNLAETITIVEHIMFEFRTLSEEQLSAGNQCTMSVGISTYKKGWDFQQWFNSADKAAYKAKQNGKNRYEIAD